MENFITWTIVIAVGIATTVLIVLLIKATIELIFDKED